MLSLYFLKLLVYAIVTGFSSLFIFGFLFMLPFGIPDILQTNFAAFTAETYATISFVIIGTTFLAYLFNIYALKYVSASVNGSYVYLQPVISFVMVSIYAFVFRQTEYAQDINIVKISSSILVIFGVYLISKKTNQKA